MDGLDLGVDFLAYEDDPRARARFIVSKDRAKRFLKARRNYKRPDFPRMILDLRNLGWSHEKIAYVLGMSNGSTVSAWATGANPSYMHGDMVVDFWKDQTGIERVPKEGEYMDYRYEIGQLGLL